jgi:uncharacterized protein (TIGR03000 family)
MLALSSGAQAPDNHGCCGCHGGCGGCYGGCYGGCGGCHGGHRHHGCCGCSGYSCCGCYGYSGCGCYGYSSCGCQSSCGCYGYSSCGCYGGVIVAPAATAPAGSGDEGKSVKPKEISAPATIVVNVPENAKLMIDDYTTKTASSTRTLSTPALPFGQEFSYTLKIEVERDGKTVTESKEIKVRANETTRATFEVPAATVAAK